jgi:hypothetical protein
MTNASFGVSRVSAMPFDQDSCDAAPLNNQPGVCTKCRQAQCTECTDPDCTCLHVVALLGRAIVELDESLDRTHQILDRLANRQDQCAPDRVHANAG